jgi:hypothetical protein
MAKLAHPDAPRRAAPVAYRALAVACLGLAACGNFPANYPRDARGGGEADTGWTLVDGGVDDASVGDASAPAPDSGTAPDTRDGAEGGGAALETVRVFGAAPDGGATFDLRIVGTGLGVYEGRVVTFRIGLPNGLHVAGAGQARVVGGAFDVLFPGVLEPIYAPKVVHFDANASGACDVGEPLLIDYAVYTQSTTLTVKPELLGAAPSCATIWKIP